MLDSACHCSICGKAQEAPADFCSWCGAKLVSMKDRKGRSPLDPAAGRNKQGIGILFVVLNLLTYDYYSHYWGVVAMVFGTLVWAWGRAENAYKNRFREDDPPEIAEAKQRLRRRQTRQALGFALFLAGAWVFYKYHRGVGAVIALSGVGLGFAGFWLKLLRRTNDR